MADNLIPNLIALGDDDLHGLAVALRSGRLAAPFSEFALQRLLGKNLGEAVAVGLQSLNDAGFSPPQMATLCDVLRADRKQHQAVGETIDLVTTGPEGAAIANRDTAVVVRDMFANAHHSVLVAGYAVYQGKQVFQALADRMQKVLSLRVQMFLDIQRSAGDTSEAGDLVRRFAERFRTVHWPSNCRLPEIFYDPRSLEFVPEKRACLHAKCVVIDAQDVFVSSANFTEAAQQRNIEIGLLIHSPRLAERVAWHFAALVSESLVKPVT